MNSQVQATAVNAIPCFNPANGERLGEVAIDNPEQVEQIVARSRAAQKDWAKSTFKQRRAVLTVVGK